MIYNLLLGGLKVLKSGGVFYDIPLLFCHFMANLTTGWPMDYKNKCLSLCKQKRFTTLLSKPMDSNPISNKHRLFAYCITDGLLDEMCPEQQASIISVIESMLSEGEDVNSERLLSGGEGT